MLRLKAKRLTGEIVLYSSPPQGKEREKYGAAGCVFEITHVAHGPLASRALQRRKGPICCRFAGPRHTLTRIVFQLAIIVITVRRWAKSDLVVNVRRVVRSSLHSQLTCLNILQCATHPKHPRLVVVTRVHADVDPGAHSGHTCRFSTPLTKGVQYDRMIATAFL